MGGVHIQAPPTSMETSIWSRAFKRQQKWEDKDDLLDVIYWMRLVVSIIVGILCGIVPLTGILGIVLYLGISCGLIYAYCSIFQQIDEDEFGGMWEILKEGFMTSFAMFLINWILIYTACHFS